MKAQRQALGMTQDELAAKTGISVKLISAYENDRVRPRKENRRLLLEALGGTWGDEGVAPQLGGTRLEGSAELPAPAEGNADPERWRAWRRKVARLTALFEAEVVITWADENGVLAAIAVAHDDNRLLTIRTRVVPSTLDDVRSLRALVDRLAEQLGPSER